MGDEAMFSNGSHDGRWQQRQIKTAMSGEQMDVEAYASL